MTNQKEYHQDAGTMERLEELFNVQGWGWLNFHLCAPFYDVKTRELSGYTSERFDLISWGIVTS